MSLIMEVDPMGFPGATDARKDEVRHARGASASHTLSVLVALTFVPMVSLAGSRDALFDDADDVPAATAAQQTSGVLPSVTPPLPAIDMHSGKGVSTGSGLKGYLQMEFARTLERPVHWSKMLTRAELGTQGELGGGIKWKMSARADYDAVFSATDFYPSDVAKDQRFNLTLRENYLDFSAWDWDFRVGRQHIVWGEMVGLFFADVVSARDMRQYILPDFDIQRIPQWAIRSEYFKDDFHAELLWIPVPSYDLTGKPGAEFYPYQPVLPGMNVRYQDEKRPERSLTNSNYGIRLSALKNGWDYSGFYYRSMDNAPTFYRQIVGSDMIFEARHDRIQQLGGTVAKDFGDLVFKGEAVFTEGRKFNVLRLNAADGLVGQNTLDWAAGLDFSLPREMRFNVQLFQRVFFAHDQDIVSDKRENGYSLYLTGKPSSKVDAEILLISSLNRTDWLLRPKVLWNFEKNWRLAFGLDIFKGPALGMFGQFDAQDRAYTELRYSF